MSESPDDESTIDWDVEVTAETADRAEELLREFAMDAELEIALVVEKSGGMIAGIAVREDVDVSTVGALVAGAFGTMGALSRELGEVDLTESFHHGENDLVYMRRLGDRFILLGVAEASQPAGLIRESAAQVNRKLEKLLLTQDDEDGGDPGSESAAEFEDSPFLAADGDGEGAEVGEETSFSEMEEEESPPVPMPALDPAVRPSDSGPSDEAEGENLQPKPTKSPRYVFEIG